MNRQLFSHIDTWVFDLDHTLYPPQMALFDQIERKMTAYVMRELTVSQQEADQLRQNYWATYGTTLAGLMTHHAVDPIPYLEEVHDISFHPLQEDPDLRAALEGLPGQKIVYTNGTQPYAEKVLQARGLEGVFDAVFGIEHAEFEPKPRRRAFERVFRTAKLNPSKSAMFEDVPRNLVVPHALGMRTVHVAPEPETADHIHHHTNHLTTFLDTLRET